MSAAVNRRGFLGRSVAGGAVLGVAAASAAETEQPAESPGRKIVIGVMGMGGRGTELACQFQKLPETEVAYVCCADKRRMEAAAKAVEAVTGKPPKMVGDFRRILDDKAVDALVIAAPDHWHAPATILACAAGKHVYVEKPCCHNPREGELQIAAARKHQRVVQMGTQRRSWPILIEAVEKLRDGAVGRVTFARAWYTNARGGIGRGKEAPVPEWLDYELWQGPAPRRPFRSNILHYNWHWFWHWGTGEIGNNGVHGLDLARWGLGVDYPRRVTSSGGRYCFDDDQESPDTQIVSYEFGDKLLTWECRSCQPRGIEGDGFGAAFYGDAGTLVLTGNKWAIYDRKNKAIEEKSGSGGDAVHLANFLAGIRTNTPPNAEIEIGYKSTLLCHLGAISQRAGRALTCDPTNGHILNDPEAMELWGREYEKGWEPRVLGA
jgi:predicted dehydrogenase